MQRICMRLAEKDSIQKRALNSLSIARVMSLAIVSSHFGFAAGGAAEVCLHAIVNLLL